MSIQDDIASYSSQQNSSKPSIQQDIAAYKPDIQNQIAGASLPGSSNEPAKVDPSFLEKLDMINTGVHRGVTHFTLGLMSKLPLGDKYQQALKDEDARVQAAQDYNKKTYQGYYPQIGEIGGETLATLPVGGLLGKVASKATALGEGGAILPSLSEAALPNALQTAGKFGFAGGAGAGVLAGMEGLKYDPNNPQGFNTKAAQDTLDNPMAYLIPAAGVGVSSWMDKAQELSQAKQMLPNIMARNLMEPGASKSVHDQIFGFLPAITDVGKQVKQMDNIGDSVGNMVQKISGLPQAMNSEDLINYAGKQVQGALNVQKLNGQLLWEKPFKTAPVEDTQGVKDSVIEALDTINEVKPAVPKAGLATTLLQNGIRKDNFTVDDVKNLQSTIGDTISELYSSGNGGGLVQPIIQKLQDVKNNLMDHIQNSLSKDQLADFSAARQHSAMFSDLINQSPLIKKAITDETASRNLIRSIIGTPKSFDQTKGAFDVMSPQGKAVTAAAQLAKIMESSTKDGGFDLDQFLNKTQDFTQVPDLMGKGTLDGSMAYQNLLGMRKYLSNINDADKVGWWRTAAIGTALAGATGANFLHGGLKQAAIPALSYLAANFVANHSPLKTAFSAVMKNLPDSTEQYLTNFIQKHLTRAGFIMDNNVLRHKDEQPVTGEQQ